MSLNRINHDLKLLKDHNINYKYNPDKRQLLVLIDGPKDSLYEDGCWILNIYFPENYPFASPSIGFINHIYHPNIDFRSGSICLDVINQQWSPIYTIYIIVTQLIPQLMQYPNPDDPLNIEAAEQYTNNIEYYNTTAKKYCAKYANKTDIIEKYTHETV